MAAHSNNCIRVRLHFEYPPPAVVDCRMCWLLVDLNRCRVVADLESVIREKFEFSRKSILSLFIEDCYLPHTESVYVVRDNDCVRVKVSHLAQVNGHSSSPLKEGSKKRRRPTEEDEVGDKQKKKKKKREKKSEESQKTDAKQADGDDWNKKSHEKPKKKKKRKEVETATPTKKTPVSVGPPVKSPKKLTPVAKPQKASSSDSSSSEEDDKAPKKTAPQKPASVNPPVKSPKKPPPAAQIRKVSSSDSSSSSSEEDDKALKKTAPQKPAPKTPSAAPKVPPITKPAPKKLNPPSSTSSDSSSDEEDVVRNTPSVIPPSHQAPSSLLVTNSAQKPSVGALPPGGKTVQDTSSDSEEEVRLVIRRPLCSAQQLGRGAGGQAPWRGRGRGRGSPADRERGRGGGRGGRRGHSNSFEYNYNGLKEPCAESDSLTNISVVVQNGAESVPKPDYSSMPLLAAPPLVGQKIAFKLLELTENYTPEVSEYKEAKIVNFDPITKQVKLELLHAFQAPVEPGKFDLVYQNEDGSERVEYAVSRGSKVTERWDSLLEPRLII